MTAKRTLIPLLFAVSLTSAGAAGPQTGQSSGASNGGMLPPGAAQTGNPNLATPVVPPLIIIAPTEVRTSPTLAGECWVRLFPEPEFNGIDDLAIAGPIELPSLHNPAGGIYWKHKAESILVGPKATVTVYEKPQYRDKAATLNPGTREPQLRKGLKFTQSIDSLKVTCRK